MQKQKKIPQRMCIACRQMKPKNDLIRIVKSQEDTLILDLNGKLNGRGAYICACEDCLNLSIKNKAFVRSFDIQIDDELKDSIKLYLARKGLNLVK